jgi:hypothetical protein
MYAFLDLTIGSYFVWVPTIGPVIQIVEEWKIVCDFLAIRK